MGVILTRAPLRVSFGGGGTDLPSYYRRHGGFVVSGAIDRYVHMLTATTFQDRYRLKHLEWEEVDDPAEIRHPILREVLTSYWNGRPLEIASVADVPAGTGLGSSGAYTVCVLKALALARGEELDPGALAERACEVEIDRLARTVGKQDQYVSAYGGAHAYTFNPDDSVDVRALELGEETRAALRRDFLLFYAGGTRSASDILADQVNRTAAGDAEIERTLGRAREVAEEMCSALEAGELARCGELMNEQWEIKRARSGGSFTERIEELRSVALESGARGAILMGAGGGGFLLVQAVDAERTRHALAEASAPELPFDLDEQGCMAVA
jgi:D-glycero-alpha-D-manno-heptose-7-phosphate kinase